MLDIIVASLAAEREQPVERNVLRLQTFGLGESSAQQIISDNIPDWPAAVELGFRAGAPQMEIKLSINSNAALAARQRCRAALKTSLATMSLAKATPC